MYLKVWLKDHNHFFSLSKGCSVLFSSVNECVPGSASLLLVVLAKAWQTGVKLGRTPPGAPASPPATVSPKAAENEGRQELNSCSDFGWATGQAAAHQPVHTWGTWPWVNWQMPWLWGVPAECRDPNSLMTFLLWVCKLNYMRHLQPNSVCLI